MRVEKKSSPVAPATPAPEPTASPFEVLGGYDPTAAPPRVRRASPLERALETVVERLRLIESQTGGSRGIRPSLPLELLAAELRRLDDEP